MKFIVDAQLPKTLSDFLNSAGHQSIHTLDLPDKNRTGDDVINKLAREAERIVITKDNDFLQSHLLKNIPPKLLLVNTGNISNRALLNLFKENLSLLIHVFQNKNFVELTKEDIIVHE